MTNTIKWDKPCYKCLSHLCDLSCKETSKTEEQDDEVLGFNGWGFPIEKPNKVMTTQTEALELALEALEIEYRMYEATDPETGAPYNMIQAITAIKEALAQPEQEKERCVGCEACIDTACGRDECPKGWPKAAQPEKDIPKIGCVNHDCDKCKAQPEQEPVAMKFKIYKPTVPDPTRQDINNALLPWVYDQDRSSGFDASMWVTPVSTLPPQRTWVGLTTDDWDDIKKQVKYNFEMTTGEYAERVSHLVEDKLREKNTLLALPVVTLPLEIK